MSGLRLPSPRSRLPRVSLCFLPQALNTAHVVWAAPLRILVAVLFLYNVLGVAAVAGFAAILALLPVQLKVSALLQDWA